jgi:hypothetical protein
VVPTRDSRTGMVTAYFRDAFEARRSRGMRADIDAAAWGTLYRLAANTAIRATGRPLSVGDVLSAPKRR